jgi:hypothetical protein
MREDKQHRDTYLKWRKSASHTQKFKNINMPPSHFIGSSTVKSRENESEHMFKRKDATKNSTFRASEDKGEALKTAGITAWQG